MDGKKISILFSLEGRKEVGWSGVSRVMRGEGEVEQGEDTNKKGYIYDSPPRSFDYPVEYDGEDEEGRKV